jgi:hypothetical protein
MQLSIPSGWDSVTPEWMTSALADAFPGVEVRDLNVELRDDGTTGARVFNFPTRRAPARVFVKAADLDSKSL